MKVDLNLDRYAVKEDELAMRNGKRVVLCRKRNIWVWHSLKEDVRQKLIHYLVYDRGYSINDIYVDVKTNVEDHGHKARLDLLVQPPFTNGREWFNALTAQCIPPGDNWVISEEDVQTNFVDAVGLNARQFIITDGSKAYCYSLDDKIDDFTGEHVSTYISEEPASFETWQEILRQESYSLLLSSPDKSFNHVDPIMKLDEAHRYLRQTDVIGDATPKSLWSGVATLHNFIHVADMKQLQLNDTLTKYQFRDHGLAFLQVGTGGGPTFADDYRVLSFDDEDGNKQSVGLNIVGRTGYVNHPKWGTRHGTTSLHVCMLDFEKAHNSLQLNLDKHLEVNGNTGILTHDGRITIGKTGGAEVVPFVDFMKQKYPQMLVGNTVMIGSFPISAHPEDHMDIFIELLHSLITYAEIRDEYRKLYKDDKKAAVKKEKLKTSVR